jgi:hypothetical protein
MVQFSYDCPLPSLDGLGLFSSNDWGRLLRDGWGAFVVSL